MQRKWRHGGENKELSGYDELTVTEELRDGERVGNTQGLGVSPWDAEQARDMRPVSDTLEHLQALTKSGEC